VTLPAFGSFCSAFRANKKADLKSAFKHLMLFMIKKFIFDFMNF
jgi:hypothetical protein